MAGEDSAGGGRQDRKSVCEREIGEGGARGGCGAVEGVEVFAAFGGVVAGVESGGEGRGGEEGACGGGVGEGDGGLGGGVGGGGEGKVRGWEVRCFGLCFVLF